MKKYFTLMLLFLALHTFPQEYSSAKLNSLGCQTIGSFTIPSSAWGLDNQGSDFWVSLTGYYDKLFKFDVSGNKIDSVTVPYYGSGASYGDIEISGNNLWVVNESPSTIVKVDLATKNVLLETELPDPGFDGNYFSVAYDGTYLWVWNYGWPTVNDPKLLKLDPATHAILDTVDVQIPSGYVISVIEQIGNEMWGLCPTQCFPNRMFRIDPLTGELTDSSEWCLGITPTPYGFAWDGSYLWEVVADIIYKININPSGVVNPSPQYLVSAFPNPASSSIQFTTREMQGWLSIRSILGAEQDLLKLKGLETNISLDTYPSGMYEAIFLDTNEKMVTTISFAVQK